MAFIGMAVPHTTARLLSDIEVPGTKEPRDNMHITLLFLGNDVSIEVLAEAMKASLEVTSKTKPFSVRTSQVSSFPTQNPDYHDGQYPIIAKIDSDALHDLREELATSLDANGVNFSKKYPEYKPHVTLAFNEATIEEFRIPTVEWGAHELVLWGGDDGDKKVIITFPFALQPLDKTAERVADRYQTSA